MIFFLFDYKMLCNYKILLTKIIMIVFFIFLDQVQGLWAAACLMQMHSRHLQESEPLPSLSLIWRAVRCLVFFIINLFA